MWHFRLVVPKALRPLVGLGVIKRSLHTKNTTMARLWAYALGAKYAQVFANAMEQGGKGMGKHWDDDAVAKVMQQIAANAPGGVSKMLVDTPDGWRFQSNGTKDDNDACLEALRMHLDVSRLSAPVAATLFSNTPRLDEAIRDYGDVEAKHLKPNTWSQRSRALNSFAETIGGHVRVGAITRALAATWSDGLIRSGKSKVYAVNRPEFIGDRLV